MGTRMPETCWAVFKRQAINLRNCCIWLVDSFECMMMHGLATPKLLTQAFKYHKGVISEVLTGFGSCEMCRCITGWVAHDILSTALFWRVKQSKNDLARPSNMKEHVSSKRQKEFTHQPNVTSQTLHYTTVNTPGLNVSWLNPLFLNTCNAF